MSNDDHERLIRVAANWYGLYNQLFVKAQRLTDENAQLREQRDVLIQDAATGFRAALGEGLLLGECEKQCARARALISWIDGALVDESPHMEIRAAINRYWESQK